MNVVSKFIYRTKEYGLKYVLQTIVRNKIFTRIEVLNDTIGSFLFKRIPLKETIILESHNDFDSNGGAFYDYLIKHNFNKKYKIVWFLRNNKKIHGLPHNVKTVSLLNPSLKKIYYLYTSKYILTCHSVVGSKRANQLSYYLTHGAISLKNIRGKINLPKDLNYCLIPSKYFEEIFKDQYSIRGTNVQEAILGFPSHDILYEPSNNEISKITNKEFTKTILWMPTFRKTIGFNRNDSLKEYPTGIPIFEDINQVEELNKYLAQKNILLIIKIHPMQDLTKIKLKSYSNIIVLDGNKVKELDVDNYRLMKDTDALISDYSSVTFDYLHLNRPIAYTLDDKDEYKNGFIVENPETLMAGPQLFTIEDFYSFIIDVVKEKDSYAVRRKELFDTVFKYHDGNSCQRLSKHMGID